jgi:NAD(P)-dependent dehydrogenase (short-subunit alcohol dehydrogenase family)
MNDDRLSDRHIIVTGAAQGIGQGIAERVAQSGADVTIFDVDTEQASQTRANIEAMGPDAQVVEVDVSDAGAVANGVASAIASFGPIDGLVNNAGIQNATPIVELTEAEWDAHMDVNAKGVFLCCREVASHMIKNDIEGSFVNIASTAVNRPHRGQGVYAATKAGVVGFTIVLAKELGEHGITANCINPGTVETPMVQQWLKEHADQSERTQEEILEESLEEHIIRRMGQPREIGNVATLLLSDEAEWITGEAINVDGGYTVK